MQPDGYPYHAVGHRIVGLVATVLTGLCVAGILGFGYAIVTTDWSALACFDGNEPACKDPDRGPATLADIRASSWVLAVLSLLCVVGGGIVSLRLRRARSLAVVATLCLVALAAASLLWTRT